MDQDWEPVIIKRSGSFHSGGGSLPARRDMTKSAGGKVIVARTGDQSTLHAMHKLESEQIGKPKELSVESRTELIQKRVALGKNQIQLNQDCRFPVNTMREIEADRLCPTPAQLNMLNRVLKASLKYA